MTATKTSPTSIPVAERASRFAYAIRDIVEEARRVEAAGTRVRYLNIGDPVAFGFETPPHMIEAVERGMAPTAMSRRPGFCRHAKPWLRNTRGVVSR